MILDSRVAALDPGSFCQLWREVLLEARAVMIDQTPNCALGTGSAKECRQALDVVEDMFVRKSTLRLVASAACQDQHYIVDTLPNSLIVDRIDTWRGA